MMRILGGFGAAVAIGISTVYVFAGYSEPKPLARVDPPAERHFRELAVNTGFALGGRKGGPTVTGGAQSLETDIIESGLPGDIFARQARSTISVVHEEADDEGLVAVTAGEEYAWDMTLHSTSANVALRLSFYDDQQDVLESYQLTTFDISEARSPFSYGQRFLVPSGAKYLATAIELTGSSIVQVVDSDLVRLR